MGWGTETISFPFLFKDFMSFKERLLISFRYMKELIEIIAKALVDYPNEVQVSEVEGANSLVIELKVAKSDIGKVIGKQGRTAQSMRTILNAASRKIKKNAVLEIIE